MVEDNVQLRRAAVRQLKALGYVTYEAENAEVALLILEGKDVMDLLFSDVVMPGDMDGIELAHEATRLHPRLRVLLTSGFPDLRGTERRMTSPGYRLLNKPYRHDELARSVREVLDKDEDQPLANAPGPAAEANERTLDGERAVTAEQV